MTYENFLLLAEDRRQCRRTIADVLDVAQSHMAPQSVERGTINLAGLRLPDRSEVALVAVLFPERGCAVTLPLATKFRALSAGQQKAQVFDIFDLDGAEVEPDGHVTLFDGRVVRGVTIVPRRLPKETELDRIIVKSTVEAMNLQSYCYRRTSRSRDENAGRGFQ